MTKHGMSYSPAYQSWAAMKARCLRPSSKDYPKWGGRGVTVFDGWRSSFTSFYEHVGDRPEGTTLDRIDGSRGYEPGNVRWATASEQNRNKATSYYWHIKGLSFDTAQEAADFHQVSKQAIWQWAKGFFSRGNRIPARKDCYVVPRY